MKVGNFFKPKQKKLTVSIGSRDIIVDEEGFWTVANALLGYDFSQAAAVRNAYLQNPELQSIVDYIARSVSLGRWQHTRGDDVIENSPLTDKLNKPHPVFTSKLFKQAIATELLLHGRCHIWTNTPKIITEKTKLFILPASITEMHASEKAVELATIEDINDVIKFYRVTFPDGNWDIQPTDVLTITTAPITIEGKRLWVKSPLTSLSNVLKVTPTLYESLYELNYNRGAVGIISNRSTDSAGHIPFSEREQEKIQRDWKKKYGTLKDRWQLLFSNLWLDYQQISSPIVDLGITDQQKLMKEVIADIYGFNTLLLNNNEGNKYANYQEARRSFFSEVVIPLADTISNAFQDFYLYARKGEDIILYYRYLEVFATDKKLQAESLQQTQSAIIQLNEAVNTGAITREIAVSLLMSNGYTQAVAESLIVR